MRLFRKKAKMIKEIKLQPIPVKEWIGLLSDKHTQNRDVIYSKDFQEWIIHVKANRVITTNFINL